jgi:hypothetical protein
VDNEAILSGVVTLAIVVVYGYLGWRLIQRRVSDEARLPATQFGLFWIGLAAVSLVTGVESLGAAFYPPNLALVVTGLYLQLLLICLLLWGLLGYLIYLFLGRHYLAPLTALYTVSYVLLLYAVVAADPSTVTLSSGVVSAGFANPVGGYLAALLFVVLIVPELAGALLYFTLFFRTRDRTVRFRVTLVSWSLFLWFGLTSLHFERLVGGGLASQLASSALGAVAAVAIFVAYYPPPSVRSWLGVQAVDQAGASL